MQTSGKVFTLKGVVQHYSWGGHSFIPSLLGLHNADGQPWAEYWMGAHPKAPALVEIDGEQIPLDTLISTHGEEWLGEDVSTVFGGLPYLFKVLDVQDMLSIQVHPSKAAAEDEFAREEAAGIPLAASNRNYKDRNHKPELMWALGPFWLLHGFLAPQKMAQSLGAAPELSFLLPVWEKEGYKGIYKMVMEMEQAEVNSRLKPLIERALSSYEAGTLDKEDPGFWAARAYKTFCRPDFIDRGIFSIYFFNIVHLEKGQAIFQDAGILHAYLEGQNLELMANSDNVLRGGLTNKHVDVPELMKHVRFEATVPEVLKGLRKADPAAFYYPTPAADFELNRWDLKKGQERMIHSITVDIFLVAEGDVTVECEGKKHYYAKGATFLTTKGTRLNVKAAENSSLFRATVPR